MITIQLQLCHDRRTVETTLSRVNNDHQTPVTGNSSLAPILTEPLSQWLAPNDQWPGFFAMIRKYYGTSGFAITFTGEEEDYRLLEQARDQYALALHMSVELVFRNIRQLEEAEAAIAELQQELAKLQRLRSSLNQVICFTIDTRQLLIRQNQLKQQLRTKGPLHPEYTFHYPGNDGITREYLFKTRVDDYVRAQQHFLRNACEDSTLEHFKQLHRTVLDPLKALLDSYDKTLTLLGLEAQYPLEKPSTKPPRFQPPKLVWPRLHPTTKLTPIGTFVAPADLQEDLLKFADAAFDDAVHKTLQEMKLFLAAVRQQAKQTLAKLDQRIQQINLQILS